MQPRKLTAAEVTFTVDVEAEDIGPEDQLDDADTCAWVRERLDTGHQEAWCYLQVKARWGQFLGTAGLGCVSLDCGRYPTGTKVGKAADAHAREQGLLEESLDALNDTIANTFEALNPLLEG